MTKVSVYCESVNTVKKRYHIYDGKTHTTAKKEPKEGFYMLKGFTSYDTVEECLEQFYKSLFKWADEIKNEKKLEFDYLKDNIGHKYFYSAMYKIVKRSVDKCGKKPQDITFDECKFYQRCYNAGIMSADEYEGEVIGYDFKSFYPNILSNTNFQIPIREGTFTDIEELPKKIPLGIYNVKITSKHPKIKFLFGFSKHQHYTNIDITYARFLKTKGLIDTIELQHPEDDYNALIYDESCVISSKDTVGKMYRLLLACKERLKGNPLIKLALNRMWGYMARKASPYSMNEKTFLAKTEEEKAEYQIIDIKPTKKGGQIFTVIKKARTYMEPFRHKVFLTSFARKKMGNKILDISIDDCVRVHTDGVMFRACKKTMNKQTRGLEKDEGHTGHFKIKNLMKFEKVI